ncbi:hypothetical protein GCM10009566_64730 [Streptomyces murinus]|uniref:Chaperonin GroEL (HSP60 family) n=1 Tax=Streptomyces murinus TaxID=33900 RepID=A0A7W3NJY0_STRMR|nr:chaperonin GroEL (HSP60 family) [Streptomyces murinus]
MPVKVTLDPKGRNVVLEKKWGAPTITNDGVSMAKGIELEDLYEKIGAELVKEVDKAVEAVSAALLEQAKELETREDRPQREGGVVVEKVRTLPVGHALDAATREWVDMLAAGSIDPGRSHNAASIAGLFLPSEALIAEKREEKEAATAGAGADL